MSARWADTPETFRNFLRWLDEGTDSGGESYVEMRRRLVAYFQRKRCLAADDLADETLHRVARRLEQHGTITDTPPAKYCYITAKFIFLEDLRERAAVRSRLADRPADAVSAGQLPGEAASKEMLLNCLDECLTQLAASERELILDYYRGERASKIERRRQLAQRLAITANALGLRASRIRDKLESCVKRCAERR